MPYLLFLIIPLLCITGCQAEPEPELLLAPDSSTGAPGTHGRQGVERVTREFRVRVDDRVRADIYLPILTDGSRMRAPIAVMLQGGLVEANRYAWLATHLASRGYIVVTPDHTLNLTFFEEGNTLAILDLLSEDEEVAPLIDTRRRGLVLGHSLGGVTAASLWLARPQTFSTLLLLASVPRASDDFSTRPTIRDGATDQIVSIASSQDGRITQQEIRAPFDAMAKANVPINGLSIQGMIHMQWVIDPTPEELENDGVPTIAADVARQRALIMIDLAIEKGPDAISTPNSTWPEGVLTLDDALTPEATP